MQFTQLIVSLLSALPLNTFDGKRRRSIELLNHHTLLNLSNLLIVHAEAKSCCKWYLLALEARYTFKRLINVGLHG